MLPTIRSVLDGREIRGALPEIVSGADSLDRGVRWVHVSEVREVAGLLQGGELLLSTGLAMSGTEDDAAAYISDIVAARAAGLVIELSQRFPVVPEPALALARDAGLPVVVLRRRARFVLVTEEVHRAIVAERFDQLRFAQEVHETFTALSLDGALAQDIVETTAGMAGSSVVLEDLARHVVAYSATGRPGEGLLADWDRRSRLTPLTDGTGISGPEGWVTTPVGGRDRTWGRLVIPNAALDQERIGMLVERAAQALELARMIERDRSGLQRQAHEGFLADVLTGRLDGEAAARARAESLGLPRAPRFVPVVVALRETPPSDPVTAQSRSRRLAERVTEAVAVARLDGLTGGLPDGHVAVLLAGRLDPEDDALTALASALEVERGDLALGVGSSDGSVLRAASGLRAAQQVAEVARTMPDTGRAFHRHADIRLHGLLAQLHGDSRIQAFAEAELEPLLVHDARHGGDLLELLRLYLSVGGNKAELARVAHRSRPALYKKLERLERILGVPLDEPASRLSLGVALLAHDSRR